MLLVKCGRCNFELTLEDKIMYNGFCYQIITREIGIGRNTSIPKIPKNKAENLIKEGKLVFSHKEMRTIEVEIFKIVD